MRGFALALALVSVVALTLVLSNQRAQSSFYTPDDNSFTMQVGTDGKAQAFEFDRFLGLLAKLTNALDERKIDGKWNADRQYFLNRIVESPKNKNLTPDETASQAVYLLRVGEQDKAKNSLLQRAHDRQPNYFVFVTLGQVYATTGGDDWREAYTYHKDALDLADMPAQLKGLTSAQRNWLMRLDTQFIPNYYQISKNESEHRKGKSHSELEKIFESEEVLPLFQTPNSKEPQSPLRFVTESGAYQPGQLAASERAKLPEDAIAIVQQLLLWFPRDARLYWLLAELYAASNQVKNAATLLEKCAWSLQYSKRKIMMDHRAALLAVAGKEKSVEDTPLTQNVPATATPQPPIDPPITMRTIWYYFGAIGLIAVIAVVRAISKRGNGKTAGMS